MATKERILALLRGAEAGRIRFTVATTDGLITINRAVFATVASAIQTGKIKVTPQAVFAPGVGAEYHPGAVPGGPSGELLIPPLFGREQEGMAMHELTHAFFDLQVDQHHGHGGRGHMLRRGCSLLSDDRIDAGALEQ